MARITPDGFLKVHIVDTIADINVPSVAELGGGTEVTPFLTPAGIDTPEEGTDADSSDISSARDKSIPATIGGDLIGEYYRDDGTGGGSDDAWTNQARLTDTHLVIGRFGGTGSDNALIATDPVEVYPVRISQRSNNRATRGEALRFTVRYASRAEPDLTATITA